MSLVNMRKQQSEKALNLPLISPRLPGRQFSQYKKSRLKRSVLLAISPTSPPRPHEEMHTTGFIPFISERDGMGRLIRSPGVYEYFRVKSPRRVEKRQSVLRYELTKKPNLGKVVSTTQRFQPLVPPVGTYSLPTPWIKQSFCRLATNKQRCESLRNSDLSPSALDTGSR